MRHSEDDSQGFYPLPGLFAIIFLQDSEISFINFSHFWTIFCAVPVTSQWNILTQTTLQYLQWE